MKRTLQKTANSYARFCGCGRADKIVVKGNFFNIGKRIDPGYRKYTTGEYVPKAYLRNFGWKNTYYEYAYTEVILPAYKSISDCKDMWE